MAAQGEVSNAFLKHLLKGGIKCVPVVGALLEELIFGIGDEQRRLQDITGIRASISNLAQRLSERDDAVTGLLDQLQKSPELSGHAQSQLARLRQITAGGGQELPGDIAQATERFIANLQRALRMKKATEVPEEIRHLLAGIGERHFWSRTRARYGARHWADRASANYCPELIVCFVHGLSGNCIRTWGTLPESILRSADIDADVLSFEYPAGLWSRSSLEMAARDLRTVLMTEYRIEQSPTENDTGGYGYRHVIFISHGAGGLVVKALLAAECDAFGDVSAVDNTRFHKIPSNVFRTRFILDVAVVEGARVRSSLYVLSRAYMVLFRFAGPLFALANFLTQRKYGWGYNELVPELLHNNPRLKGITTRLNDALQSWRKRGYPTPVSRNIVARSDVAVRNRDGTESLAFTSSSSSGVHTRRIPTEYHELIVHEIAEVLRPYRDSAAIAIAELTIARTHDVNVTVGSMALYTGADERKGYTQAEAHEHLVLELSGRSNVGSSIILSGPAGIGKSTVLRNVASTLAIKFLQSVQADESPLPVFVPLQQFKIRENDAASLKDQTRGKALLTLLIQQWCSWIGKLLDDDSMHSDWLFKWLLRKSAVLILDSVDEFVTTNARYTCLADFTELLSYLRETNPSGLSVVVGIRDTQRIHSLAFGPRIETLSLLRLSREQALALFPQLDSVIKAVHDEIVEDFLLTPLLLTSLSRRAKSGNIGDLSSRAAVMTQAIVAIIESSELTVQGVTAEMLLESLALLAWIFYANGRGEMRPDELRLEAARVVDSWKAKLGQTWLDSDVAKGFQTITDDEILRRLLKRTVFIQTGGESVRLSHARWGEYLAARYFSHCVQQHFCEGFGSVACTFEMFRIAGEILGPIHFSADQIEDLLRRAEGLPFVVGNFCAIVTNSDIQLSGGAVTILISAMDEMDQLGRLVLLNSMTRRAFTRTSREDGTATMLLMRLREVLVREASRENKKANAISASIAWCYLRAFAFLFGTEQPRDEWRPNLSIDTGQEQDALALMCNVNRRPIRAESTHESLQTAFLSLASVVLDDSSTSISIVHYLYYLIIAARYGVETTPVARELPEILASESEIARVLSRYQPVPELGQIIEHLRELYRRSGGIIA